MEECFFQKTSSVIFTDNCLHWNWVSIVERGWHTQEKFENAGFRLHMNLTSSPKHPDIARNRPSWSNSVDKKRIIKNTLLLYVRMFVMMCISFITTRLVLKLLGVVDFGIYNLVASLTACISFFISSLSQTTQRFLSFELGKKDSDRLSDIYSQSIVILSTFLFLFLCVAELVGIPVIYHILNIPIQRIQTANLVFQCSLGVFACKMLQAPHLGVIIAHEKMGFFAWLSFLEATVQLGAVCLLAYINWNRLLLYGILMFCISAVVTLFYYTYCRMHFPYRFRWKKNRNLLKDLLRYSGWNVLGGGCYVIGYQGNNIIFNVFCGVIINSALGLAYQAITALNIFVSGFQQALMPQVTKSYAEGNLSEFQKLIFQSSRFSGYLVILCMLPIYMNADFLFRAWLGSVPEYTVLFFQLIYLNYFIDAIIAPLKFGVDSTGNIKYYQSIVGVCHLLNLPLAFAVLYFTGNPVMAICVRLVISLIATPLRGFCLKREVPFPIARFFAQNGVYFFKVIAATLIPAFLIKSLFHVDGWAEVVLTSAVAIAALGFSIYLVGMSAQERDHFRNMLQMRLKRLW